MGTTPSQVHGTLEYVVSRALLEGKTGDTTVYVAMVDFETPGEEQMFTEDAEDLVLKITISTDWVSRDEVAEIIETTLDDEEPEDGEQDDGEPEEGRKASRSTNKAKKGH